MTTSEASLTTDQTSRPETTMMMMMIMTTKENDVGLMMMTV
jgi:hypothetical protein